MRNNKLWSVLLAAVLLCACVVGVLFVGAQAGGTAYEWYVDGVGEDTDCYADINAAVKAAKAKTDWAAEDTLTITVTASGTANAATTGRALFGVNTIFRADDTKLPITISGGVNKYGFGLDAPEATFGVMATNDYTFKNLDLSSWAAVSGNVRAASGNITFENCDLGTNSSEALSFTSQITSQIALRGWDAAKWKANTTDGILDMTLTFKGTNYGTKSGSVAVRNTNSVLNSGGTDETYTNDIVIYNNMLRGKIVVGAGSTVKEVFCSYVTGTTETNMYHENMVVIDGGTVSVAYGIRNTYSGYGNMTIVMNSGTVTKISNGTQGSANTLNGNVTTKVLGGKVGTLVTVAAGTVNGNVYNELSNFTVTGTGTTSRIYLGGSTSTTGGSVINGTVYNKLSGSITLSTQAYQYLGSNAGTINGGTVGGEQVAIVNEISAAFTNKDGFTLYGGNNNGTLNGKIYTTVNEGADIKTLYAGNNSCAFTDVETTINGGTITTFAPASNQGTSAMNTVKTTVNGGTITTYYGANGKSGRTIKEVKNILLGGTITNYYGGTVTAGVTITGLSNVLGAKDDETGELSGSALITNFYGGNSGTADIGKISNTYYSGTIGAANREGTDWTNTSKLGFGGSQNGTVDYIENTFEGGTFNVGYFYCGNNGADLEGDEDDWQITNTVLGGDFARFCGGSNDGEIATIYNTVGSPEKDQITVYSGAFYCGMGGDGTTKVFSNFINYAPLSSTGDTCIYGGANGSNFCNEIENCIEDSFVIDTFYGGDNSKNGGANIINTVNGGQIDYFYGGSNKPNSGDIGTITNHIYGGTFKRVTGGSYTITEAAAATALEINIDSITNEIGDSAGVIDPPTIGGFYGGCYEAISQKADDSVLVDKYVVAEIHNTFYAADITGSSYFGMRKGDVGDVVNLIYGLTFTGGDLYLGGNGAVMGTATSNVTGNIFTTINGMTVGNVNMGMNSTVHGGALSATVSGDVTVTINGTINVGANGELDLRDAVVSTEGFTLNQINEWWDHTYFTADLSADLVTVTGGTAANVSKTDNVVVKGATVEISGNLSGNLVLTDRIAIQLQLSEDLVEAYGENFLYRVKNAEGTVIMIGNNETLKANNYIIKVSGIGLSQFDDQYTLVTPVMADYKFSVRSLATIGEEYFAGSDEIAARLYATIADLNDGTTVATYEEVTSSATGSHGTGAITINGKNLVMGDAIGIRLYADGAASLEGATVEVNGLDVTAMCNIDTTDGVIDIYVNASMMSAPLTIKVYDADGALCFTLNDQVDWIASKLIAADDTNLLAKQVLAYIQAVADYVA